MNQDWYYDSYMTQIENIRILIARDEELEKTKNDKEKEKLERKADSQRHELLKTENPYLIYNILAGLRKASADKFRSSWAAENSHVDLSKLYSEDTYRFIQPELNISSLPSYSFLIQFEFTLADSYISRDEKDFHIIDNPIRKDKVFELPYVAPTSWKGSMRSALWHEGYKDDDEAIRRIFGNKRETVEQEQLKAGRLHFYPSFFTEKGLEVINPHDRERRVGKNPILIECVPAGASAQFTLLYVPFDLVGKSDEASRQVAEDIERIVTALKEMFTIYGFGAKTSSGYGYAENDLTDGKLMLKAKGIEGSYELSNVQEPKEDFHKYLDDNGNVRDEFKGEGKGGLLSNSSYKEIKDSHSGGSLNEFKEFKRWYEEYGEEWRKQLSSRESFTDEVPVWTFQNFEGLVKIGEIVRKELQEKKGGSNNG